MDLVPRFESEPSWTHVRNAIGAIQRLERDGIAVWDEGSDQLSRWREGVTGLSILLNRLGELDPARTALRARSKMHSLRPAPIALAAVMFAGGLHLNGQDEPSEHPDSEHTVCQAQAIDRVDKLSELLLGMPRTPAVVNTLSRLGNVACRHDKDLGIRVFEKAYSVAAGLNFDLSEESSVILLSTLVSRASNCHPEFGVRSPTGREDLPKLQPRARLSTTWDAVRTNPAAASRFAHDVAETFSDLNTWGQHSFVSALTSLTACGKSRSIRTPTNSKQESLK